MSRRSLIGLIARMKGEEMDKPFIMGPRQERAIRALFDAPIVTRVEMDKIFGAKNSPEVIRQVRLQGFSEIILTGRLPMVDRDGKVCYPGYYYVNDADKIHLLTALEEKMTPKTGATAAGTKDVSETTNLILSEEVEND
jgi:hypothetical protein